MVEYVEVECDHAEMEIEKEIEIKVVLWVPFGDTSL